MSEDTLSLPLHRIAHGRAGDKGNRLNVSVIAYRAELFACLVEQVTEERVAALFAYRGVKQVKRYVLPKLGALNFVIDEALDGGVNQALNLDAHGKTLSYLVLGMPVEVPRRLLQNWTP
jgi:hypothetical protein